MSDTDRQRILNTARDALLAAFPNVWAIYAYGSFARGDQLPQSDIDLALLLPPDEKIDDLLSIISDVSTRVHREVDLVDLRKVNDVLRREVLAEGQTLYVSQPDRVLEWEGTAISRYQRYREEVSDLLKDFQSTGVGYSQ
jgi:predicted nucleotidyltransferase